MNKTITKKENNSKKIKEHDNFHNTYKIAIEKIHWLTAFEALLKSHLKIYNYTFHSIYLGNLMRSAVKKHSFKK